MNPIDFIELGTVGVALIIMFLIVKEFLKFARNQENNFTQVISNHLHSSTKSLNKLDKTIQKLISFLKENNKKKKK